MHLCLLSEHFHKTPSGPRKAALRLCQEFAALGHRVSLLGIAPEDADETLPGGEARLRRYSWRLIPVGFGRSRFYARELCRIHRGHKIDVVIAMGLDAASAAERFRSSTGTPFVINPRSYLAEPANHPRFELAAEQTAAANSFVALSQAACNAWFKRLGAVRPAGAFGVLNGCDRSEFEGESTPLPAIGTEVPVILSMGMLRRPKGHHVVLRALAQLKDLPWRLVIAGEGPARAELESAVKGLGLAERVTLAGVVEGPQRRWLFRNAQLFCLFPIYFEVCGNAFLEAQAAGLPVIASNAGALAEVLVDGASALLVPLSGAPDVNEEAATPLLAQALREALGSADLRARLAAGGLARAAELTWRQCADGYLRAVDFALAHEPQPLVLCGPRNPAAWGV